MTEVGREVEVLLDYERTSGTKPILEALLDRRNGDHPPDVCAAADRVLRAHAPWALDLEGGARSVIECAGDARRIRLFTGWAFGDRRPTADLAREEGISGQLAGYQLQRAAARVRDAAATTPPWPWLVEATRRSLGRLTTASALDEVLVRLGVATAPEAELLSWLAGPYHPVPHLPGWLAVEPRPAVSRTAACLASDGGVRRLPDLQAELDDLEVSPGQFVAWLQANGATVVHDLAVLVTGSLGDAVERVLDAHGSGRTAEQIECDLLAGGRSLEPGALERCVRSKRFSRSTSGRIGLSTWGGEQRRPTKKASRPKKSRPEVSTAKESASERLWLWIKVDDDVLRGSEAAVPAGLVEGVGLAPLARRTFSSRWGPVTLAHDGPQPTRGSVRAVALAAGANPDDTLLLGFSATGDVAVEVRRGPGQLSPRDGSGEALVLFPELEYVNGGTP